MAKIYLSYDEQVALMLRRLIAIDAFCGTMQMGFMMPKTEPIEKKQ